MNEADAKLNTALTEGLRIRRVAETRLTAAGRAANAQLDLLAKIEEFDIEALSSAVVAVFQRYAEYRSACDMVDLLHRLGRDLAG